MNRPSPSITPAARRRRRDLALPWVAFVLIGLGVAALAHRSHQAQADRVGVETRVTAEQVRRRLEAWIDARVGLISLVSDRWQGAYRNNPQAYHAEATRLLDLYPGLQAMNWIDAQWVIRIVVPRAGNEAAQDKDLHEHHDAAVRLALRRAEKTGRTTRTGVIRLLQGGQGFATYHAVCTQEACPAGFVNAVFRIDHLVDACLAEQRLRTLFDIEFFDESGASVYHRHVERNALAEDLATEVKVRVVEGHWTLRLAPSATNLEASLNSLPSVVFGVGICLAGAIAWLLWLLAGRHRALLESELRYRTLFEASSDAILLLRGDRFVDCNQTACALFGAERGQIIGRTPWELSPPEQGEGLSSVLQAQAQIERARGGAPVSFEWVHLRSDGLKVTVEVTLTELKLFDRLHLLAVLRDIETRKQTERQQRELHDKMMHAQKLESLGVLAGGIAHDFNNIVQVIRGNAELAARRVSEPEAARNSLREVELATRRAAELCRQLLAYSGRGRFEVTRLDLGVLVRDMTAMLQVAAPKKVQLTIHTAPILSAVQADATQMRQVVMNLITNAAEAFLDQSGVVEVTVDEVEVAAPIDPGLYDEPPPSAGTYVRVRVRDTGAGMEPATRQRLFEPFFSTKFSGRGLGLAAVLGIVRAHLGAISVSSEPGRGTTFEVLLPAVAGRPSSRRALTPAPMEILSPPGVVLLADDEEGVVALGTEVLQTLGYTVLTATDGREAVEVFHAHIDRLDCVILDLTMPHLSGNEVYQEIRRHRAELPVVLCSGYEEVDTAEARGSDPAFAFLQKPYALAELALAMRAAGLHAGGEAGETRPPAAGP